MHTSSPTDSSRSASSPTTSDSPHAWPTAPTPTIRPPQVRRKPVSSHIPTNSSSTGGTRSTGPGAAPLSGAAPGAPTMIKSRRFYSSPLSDDSPDPKTPLQAYGLEQREPSIIMEENNKPNKLLRRVSHALDDIKEDFSLQLDPRGTAERMRSRRRESAFFDGPPVAMPSPLGALGQGRPETAASRPLSIFSLDFHAGGGRRLTRRLSMLGSNLSQRGRKRFGESISQPNLIGSSTHM